jgi:hypothetical protein
MVTGDPARSLSKKAPMLRLPDCDGALELARVSTRSTKPRLGIGGHDASLTRECARGFSCGLARVLKRA